MSEPRHNPQHVDMLDSMLLGLPEVKRGRAFGAPAYYVGKKMFACVVANGVSIKLPEAKVKTLLDDETFVPFGFEGRNMREWVVIRRPTADDYQQDESLLREAMEYVAQTAK